MRLRGPELLLSLGVSDDVNKSSNCQWSQRELQTINRKWQGGSGSRESFTVSNISVDTDVRGEEEGVCDCASNCY